MDKIELEVVATKAEIHKEMVKEALKEGLKEWMNERFQEVGTWTVRAFLAALFGALIYIVMMTGGWHPTK